MKNHNLIQDRNIILVAPPFIPIHNEGSLGGIEKVLVSLNSKYNDLGINTKIICTEESTIPNSILTIKSIGLQDVDESYLAQKDIHRGTCGKLIHAAKVIEYANKNPDSILHVFDDHMIPFLPQIRNVSIMHLNCPPESTYSTQDYPLIKEISKKLNIYGVSKKHKANLENEGITVKDHIYNGIPVQDFQFKNKKENYVLSLGAIAPHKGQADAIEAALSSNTNIILAGLISDHKYYSTFAHQITHDLTSEVDKLQAYLRLDSDKPKVVYVGTVNEHQKKPLFSNAKAFLMPIHVEETFGIVMTEALASGTPVIGFNRGSIPEIIIPGKTGYVCNNAVEMAKYIGLISSINPLECRLDAEKRFSIDTMANRFIEAYQEAILSRQQS